MSTTAVAGFVGLGLLNGALSFVGGETLRQALGYPAISDVRIWIRHAVAELKAFVSSELQRQLDDIELRDMENDLQGILNNLYQYAELSSENQKSNRFLLDYVTISTAHLVPRSLRFDQAYFVTTTAIAYRLFVLQTLFVLDDDDGHIKSAKPMIDGAITQLVLSRNRLSKEMSPGAHFDIVCSVKTHQEYLAEIPRGPGDIRTTSTVHCFGMLDGHQITDTYSADFREERILKKQVEEEMAPRKAEMKQQAQDFKRKANASLFQIIDCYDKMCKKIGETYTPPEEAVKNLGKKQNAYPHIRTINIPDSVQMPGASVRSRMAT